MPREKNRFGVLSAHSWHNLLSLIQKWSSNYQIWRSSSQFCDGVGVAKWHSNSKKHGLHLDYGLASSISHNWTRHLNSLSVLLSVKWR